jgi:deferrochelatase/peroxidase EfeB
MGFKDGTNDARLLRRGYNFVDGSDGLGRLDAGLFFLAYQRDPHKQFVPIQANLARGDLLNEYLRQVGQRRLRPPSGRGRRWLVGPGPVRLMRPAAAGRDCHYLRICLVMP